MVAVIIEHPVLRCPLCKSKRVKIKKTESRCQDRLDRWYHCEVCKFRFRTREFLSHDKISPNIGENLPECGFYDSKEY